MHYLRPARAFSVICVIINTISHSRRIPTAGSVHRQSTRDNLTYAYVPGVVEYVTGAALALVRALAVDADTV